jgi:hypothetical protein
MARMSRKAASRRPVPTTYETPLSLTIYSLARVIHERGADWLACMAYAAQRWITSCSLANAGETINPCGKFLQLLSQSAE